MIALTQEKREELIGNYTKYIDWCNGRLSSYLNDFDRGATESSKLTTEIALASLTADIFAHVDGSGLNFYRHPSATIEYAIEQGDQVTALYTAPPVPEVTTYSELTALLNAVESFQVVKASDKWNESGKWDNAYDKLSEAAIKAAPLIKRLNGWGE